MVLCLFCLSLRAQGNGEKLPTSKASSMDRLAWIEGPTNVNLVGRATLKIPKGFRFLEAKGAQEFLKKTGNRPSGQETGLLMHTQDEWWVILEFEEIGYVKDDEKKELDADKLIASYRQGSESMN
jgi:uncharacterized membrane-anchored protein